MSGRLHARLRALGRLTHLVWHVLCGVVLLRCRFPRLSVADQQRHVQDFSRRTLAVLGVELVWRGAFPEAGQPVLVVANHVSWLDIMALHAVLPQARFVAKADIGRWPVLGGMCRGGRTLFIERTHKRDAMRVTQEMTQALRNGDTVAIFPEGTVADGHALLPFHGNLFQSAIDSGRSVLPVALRFSDPAHAVSPVVAFTGTVTLLQSLRRVLAAQHLKVTVVCGPVVDSMGWQRRALAGVCQERVERLLSAESVTIGVPPSPEG